MPLMNELHHRISQVKSTNPYFSKDLAKALHATRFIGRGSTLSSTNKYMEAAGDLANCGNYSLADVVFVSAEGARRNRIEVNFEELALAIAARASFVTDVPFDRNRPYNIGERKVADFLSKNGYVEAKPGRWHPPQS